MPSKPNKGPGDGGSYANSWNHLESGGATRPTEPRSTAAEAIAYAMMNQQVAAGRKATDPNAGRIYDEEAAP